MAHFFKRKLFKKKRIKEKILKRIRLFNVFICRPVSLSPGKHLLPRFFRREIFHKNKFSKFRFSQNIEVIKSKHLVTLKILLHNSSFNRVHMHECIHISRLESLNKSMEAYPLAYLSFQSFENLDIRSILKALRAGQCNVRCQRLSVNCSLFIPSIRIWGSHVLPFHNLISNRITNIDVDLKRDTYVGTLDGLRKMPNLQ